MSASEIIGGMSDLLVDDGGANYQMLITGSDMISSILSFIAGFIVTVILVGLPLIVAVEVVYINFSPFSESLRRLSEKDKKLERIIGLCLRDAKTAIYRANTRQTGRSANAEYLAIKIKTVFIAFIIVGLTLGTANFVIAYLTKLIVRIISLFM